MRLALRADVDASFMNHSDRPYLSVVMASRNDDYAGGMLRRLQVNVNAFIEQTERFDLPSELLLIDWNPPDGKELWQAIDWPSSTLHRCTVRVITVPPQIHATVPFADRLPILIHRARNVGIRRARGQFVLPTSPDILFSNELVQWFARRELDPACVYRVVRRDVPEKALQFESVDKRLRYCRNHVQGIHKRDSSYRIDGLPHLFTNGAGDFTLMSRDMYFRVNGIPEEREFHSMHFDGILCFMAHAAGAREVELGAPHRIYHVDHGAPSWRAESSWLERIVSRLPSRALASSLATVARRIAPPTSAIERRGVPFLDCSTRPGRARYEMLIRSLVEAPEMFRYNDADWGMAQHTLDVRVLGQAAAAF